MTIFFFFLFFFELGSELGSRRHRETKSCREHGGERLQSPTSLRTNWERVGTCHSRTSIPLSQIYQPPKRDDCEFDFLKKKIFQSFVAKNTSIKLP